MVILGIGISKKQFDVALLKEGKLQNKIFTNCFQGFNQLDVWVKKYGDIKILACMEATGFYGKSLAEFLYSRGYNVSIVNPFRIKAYTQSKLARHKTDKKDSSIIAEYASCQNLQLLNIQKQIKDIEKSIIDLISRSDSLQQDYHNLQTIPGISKTTAIAIIAEIPNYSSFKNARQLAAFAGLTPKQRISGTSVRGKSKLSKIGSSTLRRALYFPAIVTKKYNPIIRNFCSSLAEKGKHSMVIIGAAMRKLLHIIYGILKKKVPFNVSKIS